MSEPRRPAAFRIEPAPEAKAGKEAGEDTRRPQAVRLDETVTVTPAEIDVFDSLEPAAAPPPPAAPARRSRLGTIFFAALGMLVSLAAGLWADRLIRDLFSRADWLGWLGAALTAVVALALLAILAREILALSRLASVEKMRQRADDAYERDDAKDARAVIDQLSALFHSHPDTAVGRQKIKEMEDDVIDGRDLLGIAERELLAPLDRRAQKLVLDAAKRVSLVTAVSPRAMMDVGYVIFEAARLLRRLSELYCGRPGFLGFLRLSRNVLAHLAVTGSMAMGDNIVQQIVGHGIAARLSARLGEGVVNGMMTARIGIAAISAIRPLPFRAVERPGMGDFLKALTQFAAKTDGNRS
ncbi:TIGR01620 family protein [Chelativorans sp. AA-79]|uniref:YcjF family protein n=1 Tax=Chelativorans sp. AA-79 TaxID=3028735 RepID=UPI0023F6B468|nr:TIGR01620 family protein [Chelativorans sp. AA-79]WEX07420.1 TIGR01620 family protein [Chelativorans sp. AA-79]